MKFLWTTISVSNVEESVAFYKDIVGLEVASTFNNPDGTKIAFMGSGETTVELIQHGHGKHETIGKGISIGFEVASVEAKINELKVKDVDVVAGPFSPVESIIFFYIEDPNGVRIQFVENR